MKDNELLDKIHEEQEVLINRLNERIVLVWAIKSFFIKLINNIKKLFLTLLNYMYQIYSKIKESI